ncbi:putative ribosome-binding factor A, mitochondrial isoform X2 [Oryctolagus cuniculus]|uniref:putative ribosome-binding factor A, mitochondrial isoform X2 n=1 Tax=Oryctolagus cuniculus TaxID=9986 RepID=UPI00222FEE64|nr:putative ribosome-binding factor A, mitochondrial isoform X4 [Oryctolagus cuniculus]
MWAPAGGRWGLRCGLRALLGRCDALPLPGSARGVCVTAVSCGSKNLLKKFASKAKKKFWYEGPSLGHLVSVSPDLSACRVYWKTTLSAAQNQRIEAALRRSAAHMRHLLMAQQTLRNVPPVVFVQDKESAAMAQIDQLLAAADFGPPAGRAASGQDRLRNPDSPSLCDTPAPAVHPSLCGIDHEALNKQITEYKRRKEKGRGTSQQLS